MISITTHAIQRYRERIRDTDTAHFEIVRCLINAKPSKLREIEQKKRTVYVRGADCVLIASRGRVVTVIKEIRVREAAA